MSRTVIIAAHSDDSALSLGGFLQKEKGEKIIINVFSTCAFSIISSLKKSKDITTINNQEEIAFANKIKASLYFLQHNEVLLRGYKKWNGPVNFKKDKFLIDKIYQEIETKLKKSDKVFFPIAIGNHIDHQILYSIGEQLHMNHQNDYDFYFYEDLPYAKEIPLKMYQRKFKKFNSSKYVKITDFIDNKLKLCYLYKTQYSPPYLKILKKYSNEIAPENKKENSFERLWSFKAQK